MTVGTQPGTMLIGDFAARCGVSRRALRYYEEQQLLEPVRSPNGYRSYHLEDVVTVRQIRALLDAGFTSDQARAILPCAQGEEPQLQMCPQVRAQVEKTLTRIRDEAAKLADRERSMDRLLA